MFDPTKEVPSLELCEKLKELGYPQEGGGWYFIKWKEEEPYASAITFDGRNWHRIDGQTCSLPKFKIKAPTVQELGKWLPERIETSDDTYSLIIEKYGDGWTVEYKSYNPHSIEPFDSLIIISADTVSYTMGLMLEWLVENGYVNFKKGGEGEQTQ